MIEWDLANSGHARRLFDGPSAKERRIWDIAELSPDGKSLARIETAPFGPDPQLHLYDTGTGKERHILKGHDTVGSVMFSPDSKMLASEGKDGVRIWDVAKGKQLQHVGEGLFGGARCFSPDSKLLALEGGSTICLWDIAAAKEHARWDCDSQRPFGFPVYSFLVFSGDGKLIASADEVGNGRVFNTSTGKQVARFESWGINGLAMSPSGRVVAAAYNCCGIELWEVTTGQKIRQLHYSQAEFGSLAFSPDGRLLATGGSDSTILLWDLALCAMTANCSRRPR